jgi:predicted RNase H-like HicB family nuclease
MDAKKYRFSVFWSDEDEGYVAVCPDFRHVSAFGDTPEEALAEAQIALRLVIETYQAEGWPLPEPMVHGEYSGQFRVRLPKHLHAKLATQAETEGVSLNSLVMTYLAQAAAGGEAASAVQAAIQVAFQAVKATLDNSLAGMARAQTKPTPAPRDPDLVRRILERHLQGEGMRRGGVYEPRPTEPLDLEQARRDREVAASSIKARATQGERLTH